MWKKEFYLAGFLIFFNIGYNVLINIAYSSENDLYQVLGDILQAGIAIITLFFLKHQVENAFEKADEKSLDLKQRIENDYYFIERPNKILLTQQYKEEITKGLKNPQNKANDHRKYLKWVLKFLLFMTIIDILMGNLNIIKDIPIIKLIRKWLIPFCWFLELQSIKALDVIHRWGDDLENTPDIISALLNVTQTRHKPLQDTHEQAPEAGLQPNIEGSHITDSLVVKTG